MLRKTSHLQLGHACQRAAISTSLRDRSTPCESCRMIASRSSFSRFNIWPFFNPLGRKVS